MKSKFIEFLGFSFCSCPKPQTLNQRSLPSEGLTWTEVLEGSGALFGAVLKNTRTRKLHSFATDRYRELLTRREGGLAI